MASNRRASSTHNPLHSFCEFCCFWIHICLSKCSSRWYVILAVYKSFNTGPMRSRPSSISTSHISANAPIWGGEKTRWILLNLNFLHWILMFTFSKGLCVFVYVCLCACAYLSVYIIHVDIFPLWKRYSFIFKTCFWITFWCRDCAGERIESAKTIPPSPLELHCRGGNSKK